MHIRNITIPCLQFEKYEKSKSTLYRPISKYKHYCYLDEKILTHLCFMIFMTLFGLLQRFSVNRSLIFCFTNWIRVFSYCLEWSLIKPVHCLSWNKNMIPRSFHVKCMIYKRHLLSSIQLFDHMWGLLFGFDVQRSLFVQFNFLQKSNNLCTFVL